VFAGYPRVIILHPRVIIFHPRVNIGYPRVIIFHSRVIFGNSRMTAGYASVERNRPGTERICTHANAFALRIEQGSGSERTGGEDHRRGLAAIRRDHGSYFYVSTVKLARHLFVTETT
jgi:hypothetical protein